MNIRTIRLALVLSAAGALILGACKSASPTPPAVTGTPTQSSASVTPRATHLPVRTATPRPTLPGAVYPGPVQATSVTPVTTPVTTPVITPVITPEPTQQPAQAPTTPPTQGAFPGSGGGTPTQEAYPPPGAYAPTQPGPYPGPDYPGPTPLPNPYPGPATQPPATQLPPRPTSTPGPSLATPTAAPVQTTPTRNPIYNTFTPTPTFPVSFGDSQFHVNDPATVELASGEYQFVEFFAYWCGTCRALAPLLNGLEDQYKDRIHFVYLDIDNPATQPFKKDLHFRIEPEYYLLDGQGKVVKQWSGYVSKEELQAAFDAVLK